jgi:4-diphosphocytidyl-2-C-methyl-D-erythritol kinase
MKSFKIKSYAKINLALNIVGKKERLHKIESIVSFINLYDSIYLKQISGKNHKIVFKGKFSKNIKKKNTVINLFKLLEKNNFLNNHKFQVVIIKNIPQQSGLGGGSMNAASLIDFFIKRKILKLSKNELTKLTSEIGSDVILGIKPTHSILYSNNKIKKFYKKINLHTLVVKPDFGCSTKYIYSKVKLFSKPKFIKPKQTMFQAKYLKNQNNDLEKIAFKKYPKLKKIKSFLLNIQSNIFVRMSGSGSSIVAYFHSKKACDKAYKQFKVKFNSHWCITSKTI